MVKWFTEATGWRKALLIVVGMLAGVLWVKAQRGEI